MNTATPTRPSTPEAPGPGLQVVLSSRERPPRASALSAAMTFGWRALLKIKHVPTQLFDVTMFPIMFLLLFTYLFGGALAGSTREYLQFLLPGILVMTVVMITMYTGSALNTDVSKGIFDRYRSLPIWRPAVLVGALLGDAARYSIASTIVIVLGVILGFRPEGGVLGVIAAVALVLLFSFSVSWIWTMFGLMMRTPEGVMQMSMLVLFPLTFLSNTLVDPETMPSWLRTFVNVNPISHLVSAVRGLMHNDVSMSDIGLVFAWSAALVAVFGPLTMRLYNKER